MVDRVTPEFAEPVRATERMVLARRQASFQRRTWFAVTVAVIFALHASVVAVLLWRDEPVAAARVEETPVEVVAEMPAPEMPKPAEPPAPQPQQAPQQAQPPEKPATSAPRAQNDEKGDSGESESRAPKAKAAEASPPPTPAPSQEKPQPEKVPEAKPTPAAEPPARAAEAKPKTAEAQQPPDEPKETKPQEEAAAHADDRSDAEALDKAPPEPPRRPATLAAKPSPPKPPARPARLATSETPLSPQALPTALDQLAGNSDLPDYVFAKAQRKPTKYKGGTEDNRYLAIVYAMVTQNHEAIEMPDGEWQVAVAFQVDGHGSLIGIGLTQSSGYPQIDAAAIESVRRAAPFPPPPSGGTTGMIARLSSASARAAQARAGLAGRRQIP